MRPASRMAPPQGEVFDELPGALVPSHLHQLETAEYLKLLRSDFDCFFGLFDSGRNVARGHARPEMGVRTLNRGSEAGQACPRRLASQ